MRGTTIVCLALLSGNPSNNEVGVTNNNVEEGSIRRLERIEKALSAQRAYISRVPDPDNRYRAETNLMTLLEMREACLPSGDAPDSSG